MQSPPKIGTSHSKSLVVQDKHAVDFAIPALPPVLSTPNLIHLLERAALELMQPLLDDGEWTVGVHVDVEHLAPAPIGAEVTATARVVQCDGSVITFQVEARDQKESLAKGLHKRRVVDAQRLGDRVRRKQAELQSGSSD